MDARYELFDHTADLGIRVFAPTPAGLVAPAAEGLYAAIGELQASREGVSRTWELAGQDAAGLLRDFLTELLVEFESGGRLAREIQVARFEETALTVSARLCPLDRARSVMLREVKAVTYHELAICLVDGGYEATIIVDI